ncbi:MAG: hypothetical protein FWG40_07735 [Peptococcaceae bacterium]|nr:hypothetical protein [Peptococcaceae bacterium]
MVVNGVWHVIQLPGMLVIERTNGKLGAFQIIPYRNISEGDLEKFDGSHPRKTKGLPLHEYLYSFYGLEKNKEIFTEYISVRVTPTEKARFAAWANSKSLSESEAMRSFIRSVLDES